jgi:PAS domain S-box-containing protein
MDLLKECCNSRELWDEFNACIQHVIIVTDLQGQILFAGEAVEKVLGFSPLQLEGKNLSVLFLPEDLPCFYPNLLYLASKDKVFEGEMILSRKDGTRFIAFVVVRPYFGLARSLIVFGIQDVDKRKQLERAFSETAYEDLVKIADGLAHELRNPLVGIGGFLNRLFKACEGVEQYNEYYHHIMNNLGKIETLVKKVEFFARIPRPSLKRMSIKEPGLEAAEHYAVEMENRRIELNINIEDVILSLDKELIVRVFTILLGNSLDAMTEGGEIHIHGETRGNQYIIHVTDTGAGISAKDLPFVFNPFFSTKPNGAGIDLAVVKRIMESHGGHIGVESKHRKGTTFILQFPADRRRPIRVSRFEDQEKSTSG